ncbi:MAG TPA: hypothetical protein VGA47_00275 [Candidatus Dormibacteraeota bacterium]
MHQGEESPFRWPDIEVGPWEITTKAAIVGGRWELIGLTIQPVGWKPGMVWAKYPTVALTSTVLKQLHLPELFAEHRRQQGIADESLAHTAGFKIELRGRKLSAAEAERFLKSKSSAAPRTGRPTHWNPARLAQVAGVYREAWSARRPPTAAVASRFHLSASGAAKVVRLARANGLLPPTTRGKAGWIEALKDRKQSKERK